MRYIIHYCFIYYSLLLHLLFIIRYKTNPKSHTQQDHISTPSTTSPSLSSSSSSLSLSSSSSSTIEYPNENNTAPIRFHLDTLYLDEDPGYSCYYEHEIVKVNNENYTCKLGDILTPAREEY